MNKVIQKVFILTTFLCEIGYGAPQAQTFLSVPPLFMSGSPERESLARIPPDGQLSLIQVVPLFSQSVNPEDMASFFLPSGKFGLFAVEDHVDNYELRDLDPLNFNLETKDHSYKSILKFWASQKIDGLGLAYRQQVGCYWWIELATPFIHVENKFGFDEYILDNGGGAIKEKGLDDTPRVATMRQAFKQRAMKYDRIDSCETHVKNGFADVELKIGYQPQACEDMRLYGYVGVVFPTGNKPEGKIVFEPIVGNNGHYGFLYGSHLGVPIWNWGEHTIHAELDFHTRYLFRNEQIRTFDLKNKQFSRYIAMYRDAQQAEEAAKNENPRSGTFGANLLSQPVRVFPGLLIMTMNSYLYTYRGIQCEVGYNMLARQAEKIEVIWDKTSAVMDSTGEGKTNKARNIAEAFPGSAIPVDKYDPLLPRDIETNSAAMPAMIEFMAYGAASYTVIDGNNPVIIGGGASYMTSINRTDVNRWLLWGKLAVRY